MSTIPWLGPNDPFPDPRSQPDPDPEVPGLLAVSERIYSGQLERAYRSGIFPWYSDHQPVLWWSPDPRMTLNPANLKISQSLRKTIRATLDDPSLTLRVDHDFSGVMRACATTERQGQDGTWITHEIMNAYTALHEQGHAHCITLEQNQQAIGGLYCVSFGGMVFGESMFSKVRDSSKLALAALCAWCYDHRVTLIDCQQETAHLRSLGAIPIGRSEFLQHVACAIHAPIQEKWVMDKFILERYLR
ncbi:leucyl/phenylalanyl-tRNA--protein transferase [Polynucleobacter sp. MWH-UH24A]|uniref:leucyl/phenylalanyl-tRNA--protein transferase n=1 Tax=Polynucleobacter sp. MWH-UH24A TaxID=2689110 RepID=UPI001BFD8636|nr:leucyl/phenylalanyl-tRNA--protein transferase [Polynucleobacter sp. MWH-UH24A]QWD75302.1 leucyl/phenylalanyl-tRNA--protein transferase [Polynucleobacter sp. MWH-UH24A]